MGFWEEKKKNDGKKRRVEMRCLFIDGALFCGGAVLLGCGGGGDGERSRRICSWGCPKR